MEESAGGGAAVAGTVYVFTLASPHGAGAASSISISLENGDMLSMSGIPGGRARFELAMRVAGGPALEALRGARGEAELFGALLLSCNLVLERAVFTAREGGPPGPGGGAGGGAPPAGAGARAPFDEILDERAVLRILDGVLLLDAEAGGATGGLGRALLEYERAMSEPGGAGVFRRLYGSLGLAADPRGRGLRGDDMDEAVSRAAGADVATARGWRLMGSRFGGPGREGPQGGPGGVEDEIPAVRRAAQRAILAGLLPGARGA